MVRTLVTPQKDEISIRLPESYIGREVEVIVFATDESEQNAVKNNRDIPFIVLHVENKSYKFDRDEANER